MTNLFNITPTRTLSIRTHIPSLIHQFVPYQSYLSTFNPLHQQEDVVYRQYMDNHSNHDIVLFMGTCTERRIKIITQLEYLFYESHHNNRISDNIQFYSICDRVFYYHQDYYLMKAKVILNIASSNVSIFETHRINYFLSLGKVVVSEVGADRSIAERYKDGVVLVPREADCIGVVSDERGNKCDTLKIIMQAETIFSIVIGLLQNASQLEKQGYQAKQTYNELIRKIGKQQLVVALNETFNMLLQD